MSTRATAGTTAVLYNGLSSELLVAYVDAATGNLHTMQFEETRADRGETERMVDFDWERQTPAGVGLVIPEAGHPLAKIDEYWALWQRESVLYGLAAHHPAPISTALAEEEWLIERPIVARNQEMHVYGWRGGRLVRHRYGAPKSGLPVVHVEPMMDLPARPARSVCGALPGDDEGTAVIGYVNDTDGTVTATVLYARGGKVMPLEGKSEGRYRLMRRHRMGFHVGTKMRPALAMMGESLEDGGYVLLEARFDFKKQECVWRRQRMESLRAGGLDSLSIYYLKTPDVGEPYLVAVDKDGNLISPRRRTVVKIRDGEGTGYSYPIVTTGANRYEAVGEGREIRLRLLPVAG
jgi:hypothetical protein